MSAEINLLVCLEAARAYHEPPSLLNETSPSTNGETRLLGANQPMMKCRRGHIRESKTAVSFPQNSVEIH